MTSKWPEFKFVTDGCLQEWKASNSNFKLPEPVSMIRFLYELCWAMIRGELPLQKYKLALDSATFSDGKKEDIGSMLVDIIAHLGQDLTMPVEYRSRLTKMAKWFAESSLVPSRLLQERCEEEFLWESELSKLKANDLKSKEVRINTRFLYQQTKFNLLREESEGYSKLLKELPSLPSKLKRLEIEKTGWTTLNFCSNPNPIPLETLALSDCPNITSLPLADEITRLAALRSLTITKCPNLISLGRYRQVETTNNCHLMLRDLCISDPLVLLMEPVRSITSLKYLSISENAELVSFPNEADEWFLNVRSSLCELKFEHLKSLESLPSSLESLSSLQKLSIGYHVPMLRELPNLPPSLKSLSILGECHPELKERYREDGGSDRHKIAHIPRIYIGY